MGSNTYEGFEESPKEDFDELDFDEKPIGSFIESSRQASVESWINSSASFAPRMPQELMDPCQEIFGDASYYDLKDESMSSKDLGLSVSLLDTSLSTNARVIDHGTGYDLVEDDLDQENIQDADPGYEIMDDSSGSETVRPLCSLETIPQEPSDFEAHAEGHETSKRLARPWDLVPSDSLRSQAICDVLDALPDDEAEPSYKDASRDLLFLDKKNLLRSKDSLEVVNSMAALSQSTQPSAFLGNLSQASIVDTSPTKNFRWKCYLYKKQG